MTLQLVHNVHILDPFAVTIYSANVGVLSALMTNFAPQQAVIDGVLHGGGLAEALEEAEAEVDMWSLPFAANSGEGKSGFSQARREGAADWGERKKLA
jgi:hypothetical protein